MKRHLALALIASSLSLTSFAQNFGFGGQQIKTEDMHCSEKFTDINYADDGQAYHTMDIYLPDTKADKYPVVVHIYGSAWFSNSSKGMADLGTICTALLKAGYAVVCPNHRSSQDAQWPAQIHDIKAVVRYLRGNAAKYHLDADHIATSGFSSGGHLSSCMQATSGTKTAKVGKLTVDLEGDLGKYTKFSSKTYAAVDWSGPIDLENMDCAGKRDMQFSPEQQLLGCPMNAENHDRYFSLSPIAYLDPKDPPIIIFHGKEDNVVPFCNGEEWAMAVKNKGIKTEFNPVEKGGHGFNMYTEENLTKMVNFLNVARGAKPLPTLKTPLSSFEYKGNPLPRNAFTADPAPMVWNDRLFVFVGHDEWYDGQDKASGGKEFNITEWLCYSTKDMKNWDDHGSVLRPSKFEWADTISPGVGIAWASQVVERNGKFYYYTAIRGKEPWSGYAIGVAVSDSPTGPYVDAIGKPLVHDKMTDNGARGWWNDIDPTVLVDDDGQAYLCWGNGTCFMAKLNADMISLDETPVAAPLKSAGAPNIWVVDVPRFTEGPWLSKRGDTYYLTYASSGFDHKEAIDYAMSKSIYGPWEHKGQVTGGAENSFTIHPGVIDFKGQSYLFYHNATLELDGHKGAIGRRSVCFDKLEYNADGTMKFVEQTMPGPKKRIVEEGGTGKYKAVMTEAKELPAHTVFMPQDLTPFNAENPLPVLVWGNGACSNSPWEHYLFLNEIASQGYLVVATGFFPENDEPYKGDMSTPQQQVESIEWAIAQNTNEKSPLFGKVNTKAICASGMSCGGLQTLYNCADPRISTYMICNSGLFIDPSIAMPNMPMPGKEQLKGLHAPIMYMLGGKEDIAYVNGMDDFHRIKEVPALAINYPVGHGGTYRQPHGGEFSIPAIAWLNWQLKGDAESAKMFLGKKPGILSREGWTIEKNKKLK